MYLTHYGRVTHICVSEIIIIGSDDGFSPGRRQAIIWTNAGVLLIGPLGIHFNGIVNRNQYIFIQKNALGNVVFEMASISSQPQCVKIKDPLILNPINSHMRTWCTNPMRGFLRKVSVMNGRGHKIKTFLCSRLKQSGLINLNGQQRTSN